MTQEELSKIPFTFVAHLSMEHEHCITYVNTEYNFGICEHTPVKSDGFTFGRPYRHYRWGNKVYKTLPKFLEAIKDVKLIKPVEVTELGCKIIDIRLKGGKVK